MIHRYVTLLPLLVTTILSFIILISSSSPSNAFVTTSRTVLLSKRQQKQNDITTEEAMAYPSSALFAIKNKFENGHQLEQEHGEEVSDSLYQDSRRRMFVSSVLLLTGFVSPSLLNNNNNDGNNNFVAYAATDCFKDCLKNCKLIAPKDNEYCTNNCQEYCSQDDRTDGLSGSVSAETGEVGILGGTWGQGTVAKGDDKPPSIKLPGLDFNSEQGKKLLGY